MTADISDSDLRFWISNLGRQPTASDPGLRIAAKNIIKKIPAELQGEIIASAHHEVFGSGSSFMVPEGKLQAVVVDAADDASDDPHGRHAQFLSRLLQKIDFINAIANVTEWRPAAPTQPTNGGEVNRPAPAHTLDDARPRMPQASIASASMVEKSTDAVICGPLADEIDSFTLAKTMEGSASGKGRIASGELMRLPGILPPAPQSQEGEIHGKWLDGDVWHPLAFGIHLTLREEDHADDLIEMQSEFYSMPEAARETYRARPAADPEAGSSCENARSLVRMSRDVGFQGNTVEHAAEALTAAVMRYYIENEPEAGDFLNRVGFEIRADSQLLLAISSALDIEAFYLRDCPDGADRGNPQDLRGTVSMKARLDSPVTLDRAMLLHFMGGIPITTGLVDTLRELRHAQICRHLDAEVAAHEFDKRFDFDCFFELDEYFPESDRDLSPA